MTALTGLTTEGIIFGRMFGFTEQVKFYQLHLSAIFVASSIRRGGKRYPSGRHLFRMCGFENDIIFTGAIPHFSCKICKNLCGLCVLKKEKVLGDFA
jgi:hypothetical protein